MKILVYLVSSIPLKVGMLMILCFFESNTLVILVRGQLVLLDKLEQSIMTLFVWYVNVIH